MIQIIPFASIVEIASGDMSWVQTTDTDFSSGVLENVIIEGTGTNAEVRLIKSGLEREYTVEGNTMGLWHFNETGGSTVYDETSDSNDGVNVGATQVTGKFGNGLQFDGINDYIEVPDSTSLDITDEITIEAWVKGSDSDFSATKRTTSAYSKLRPQLQVVGTKIYYVWYEHDDPYYYQIWTGEMNTDGTGFSAIKRTNTNHSKEYPQFQVVGSKIYYVWYEDDGSYQQIWTGEMNTDGTGFSATKRTTSAYDKYNPQLQVVGNKIYYAWFEHDGSKYQIWIGEMNIDGTDWSAMKRTTSSYNKYAPQLQVVGSKIYYVWYEDDGSHNQIWTAEMNIDRTGFLASKRTTSAYGKYKLQLQVVGNKIYYAWDEYDGSYYQIWTGEMNTDGTGFSATKRTTSAYNKYNPQLQVVGNKINYVWEEQDGSHDQIWTAEMNTDGTGWSTTKRTTSAYVKQYPQLQVVGNKIYYVWYEKDASLCSQIWTAEMNSNIVNKGDYYGLGISDNTVKGFINGGVSAFKYNAEAISNTAGATVESTIDINWNHITMTYDKSSLKLYVNGALVDESAFSEAINTNPFNLIIGDDFNGIIDEVRISNIVRIPGYISNGDFTSSILDTGSSSTFDTISWNPTSQPSNTDLKVQIATNNDASTWNFIGPDGTAGSYYTDSTGVSICSDHNGDRYLKYKAYLSTNSSDSTSNLHDITIFYNNVTIDTFPPTILDKSPSDTGVSVWTTIVVTFSEPMDKNSTEPAFSISPTITGTFDWNQNILTFTPSSSLDYNTLYTVSINTGAKDLAGNNLESLYTWQFTTTATPDTTPPTITETTPTGTDVPITTTISITFNEAMNKTSVQNAFSYTDKTSTWTAIDGSISWFANTMIFTPSHDLSYETGYSASIGPEAEDLSGNGLESRYTWTFTTTGSQGTISEEPEGSSPFLICMIIPIFIIVIIIFYFIRIRKRKSHEPEPETLASKITINVSSDQKKDL